jgi:membrane-associated phospholipid phosphatase
MGGRRPNFALRPRQRISKQMFELQRLRVACFVLLCGSAALQTALAADSASFSFDTALEDTKLYFTAPLRWDQQDWMYFGGALVAVATAHQFDQRVRDHFARGSNALNGGQDTNSLRDAAPTIALIAGTGVSAWFLRDSDGYQEAWSLLESGVLSSATAEVLGFAGGRERPDETTSPNRWRAGGDSFPSLHASAAWAVGTVFAESGSDDYRWLRRVLGYGAAAGTSYVRIHENVHWLSDTVAGTALGIATARFVLNRRQIESHTALQFQPSKDGWLLSYSKQF